MFLIHKYLMKEKVNKTTDLTWPTFCTGQFLILVATDNS